MAFSRNSMVAAVAGTLSLAMLTGCPNPNQTPPGAGASTAPTAAPTTGATTEPTAAPSGAPASVTPSASTLQPTTLRGKVYDEDGAVVNNASVAVKSLNPSNPFETTVQVVNGSYVANQVPAGVQLEISATKENWTSRTRVETLLPLDANDPSGNVVDFGGVNENDKEGAAYFISDRPEVTMTEPVDEAENVDPTKITVKLTLSEALDEDNQELFAEAIRVLPANRFAQFVDGVDEVPSASEAGVIDDAFATGTALTNNADGVYTLSDGDFFLDRENDVEISWDADGRVATMTLNAAYLQNDGGEAAYQVALYSDAGEEIEDSAGNVLGSGSTTTLGSYSANSWIFAAFKDTSLALASDENDSDAERWLNTHTHSVTYEVPEDDTDPTVTGVTVSGRNTIQITFSEPMAAFAGQDNDASRGVVDLENYSFVVGEDADDIDDEEWDAADATASAVDDFADVLETWFGKPFSFTGSDIEIELSESDPKVVRIIAGTGDRFITDIGAIRVRIDGDVADPAGNGVRTTNDENFVIGEF